MTSDERTTSIPETMTCQQPIALVQRVLHLARFPFVLLTTTAVALSPVLFADFIRLDDYSHLFDNPHLRRLSLSDLPALWSEPYFNLYIPMTYTAWWVLARIGALLGAPARENPWIFHLANLALHLVNAGLVFAFVKTLLRARAGKPATRSDGSDVGDGVIALLSALVFALHPVQVETVAWVSELKGALAAAFGLLGLLSHYRWGKRALSGGLFVAAMLSKPSAIAFPLIVFVVNRILLGLPLRKAAGWPAAYGLLLLPLVIVTKHVQPDANLDFVPSAAQRLLVASDAFTFYLSKVLWPLPLAVDYGRTPVLVLDHVPSWRLALSAVLLAGAASSAVRALGRARPASNEDAAAALVSCGGVIFLLSIAPVLGLVPFTFQEFSTVADHYLYVALLGIAIFSAGLLLRMKAWRGTPRGRGEMRNGAEHVSRGQTTARVLAGAVLLALGGLTFRQAQLWQSTESLFLHTMTVNPRSFLGSYSIADEHIHAGRLDQGLEWITRTLEFNPGYMNAELALGLILAQKGSPARAIEHYESVLAQDPSTVGSRARLVSSIHNNLGMLLLQVGREAEGIEHIHRAAAIFPRSLNAHLNLGNVAFDQGRYSDAVTEFEVAQALSPGNPNVERRLERARRSARGAAEPGAPPSERAPSRE